MCENLPECGCVGACNNQSEEDYLQERLYSRADRFRVSPPGERMPFYIEKRSIDDENTTAWTIAFPTRVCLNKQGELERESLPSSRPDDFIERTRYSLKEAVNLCDRYQLWEARWRNGPGYESPVWNMMDADKKRRA